MCLNHLRDIRCDDCYDIESPDAKLGQRRRQPDAPNMELRVCITTRAIDYGYFVGEGSGGAGQIAHGRKWYVVGWTPIQTRFEGMRAACVHRITPQSYLAGCISRCRRYGDRIRCLANYR